MSRFTFYILVLFAAFVASPQTSSAQIIETTEPANNQAPATFLKNVALNSSASSLKFNLDNPQGWSILMLHVDYTYANAGTLTVTCQASDLPNFNNLFTPQICETDAGVCTLNDAGTWVTASLTASKKYAFPIGILGYRNWQCSIAHSGSPSASDIVTITGYLVTQ